MRRELRDLIYGKARYLLRSGASTSWSEAFIRADTDMRCNAKTRSEAPCKARGLGKGGRCKLDGGMSTGPKTPEGKARSIAAAREGYRRWRNAQKAESSTLLIQSKNSEAASSNNRQRTGACHAKA